MDIRTPLGLMFAIFGTLLAAFGLMTASTDMYRQHSLGININLWWGLAMIGFGAVLLRLARRKRSTQDEGRRTK
jgi:hypothetical protein